MQAAVGVNWDQIIGMICGAGFVFAVFLMIAWRRRRRKAIFLERPPQRAKLRRPAGYSLQCRIDDLSERWVFALMQAVFSGSVLGLLCAGFYPIVIGLILRRFSLSEIRNAPQSYWLISAAALGVAITAWSIKSIAEAFSLQQEIRNCRFGLRGEQAVTEALTDGAVTAAGYTVFHDVPGDGPWNIDHVIVGPSGIFVLETKTRSRRRPNREQADHEVLFDGQTLSFPWCDDRKAAKQVMRNADWIRRFVEGFGPTAIPVRPIIIVPGWYVKADGKYEVKAMNAKYFASNFLPTTQRRFSPDELKPILRRLDERCRDLEF
jgi:hypothetical protein